MNIKQNPTLWIGLAIPFLMILFVAGAIYIPQLFVKDPQTNFLYIVNENNRFLPEYQYFVSEGKLVREKTSLDSISSERPEGKDTQFTSSRFFLHDVTSNTSKELTYAEAGALLLDPLVKSPDGFEVKRGSQNGGVFPFFYDGGDYSSQYLVKNGYSKKLETKRLSQSDYIDFYFLGWIIN